MGLKKVKKKEYENLTATNISRVIELLGATKPITKKAACEILNISYNTTRLTNILDGYIKEKETTTRRRNANRGKKVTDYEMEVIIEHYLSGDSIVNISKVIYRSCGFIKAIIEDLGIPKRGSGEEKSQPMFLPDNCVSEDFIAGESAWSAVYHAPCEVLKPLEGSNYEDEYGCKCYQIYIIEPVGDGTEGFLNVKTGGHYAFSTAYNLGKLAHLLKFGVKLT